MGLASAQGRPLLSVEGLVRRFGDRVALDGASFEVRAGEVFGLLGPNGAGKSTAFQILASILRCDAGTIRLGDREGTELDPAARAQMGVVFQKPSLDDLLTAEENLLLGARMYGLSSKIARQRSRQMLELIGLADRGSDRVGSWSGGMKRRLELARALIHQPKLLLMDEPTQGLDEGAFRTFWSHLDALKASQGPTVLFTTHRAEEAEKCDRLAILVQGKVIAVRTPSELSAEVGGDVISLETSEPEAVAQVLASQLGLSPLVVEGRVRVEHLQGHALIPRIVELFPPGRLKAVNLRRPTLADAFLKITGHALGTGAFSLEAARAEAARKSGRRSLQVAKGRRA